MLQSLYSNNDFQLNLLAEAHGVIAETILITVFVTLIIRWRENRKWRPARLNVSNSLCEFHRSLFNSCTHVIDPDFFVDLKAHGFPLNYPQQEANYWGKLQFLTHLDAAINRLKKTVEYNNVALDSELMPLVSDFLICSEELLNTTKFLIEAYNPKSNNQIAAFHPKVNIFRMHAIYSKLTKQYPEANLPVVSGPKTLNADQLCAIFGKATQNNPRIKLLEK